MKVLFISMGESAEDRKAWSGTVFQAIKGLERAGFDVEYLSAMRDCKQTFADKLLCTYWIRIPALFGKKTRMDESFYSVRIFRQTLEKFDYSGYDIIFVPTYLSIVNAIPKSVKAKIVHLVDATVDSLFEYYNEFSNLWFHNYWEAHILGKRAFRRADLLIASSEWCRQNAIRQYGIDPRNISVIEFGANIDALDIPAVEKKYDPSRPLRIYWSGVNWERKGGDVALECCKKLNEKGYSVEFHITGMKTLPNEITKILWVHNHGFLNKNNPEEYHRLIEIMSQQDIFLFPSRAECSSIALCEANAFGLPCFVYDTGGTANYVENGKNGYMLPLSASGADFAERIEECINNYEFDCLSLNARKKYETTLNWNEWSDRVKKAITNLL